MVSGQDLQIGRFAGGETSIQSSARVTRAACLQCGKRSHKIGACREVHPSVGEKERAQVTRFLDAATARQQPDAHADRCVFFGCSFFVFQYLVF